MKNIISLILFNISKILVKHIEDLTYLKILLNNMQKDYLKKGIIALLPLLQVFNIINYLRFIARYLKMFRFYTLFYNIIKLLALLTIIFGIFILYLFSDYNTEYLDNFINQKYIVETIREYFANLFNKISEFFHKDTSSKIEINEISDIYKANIDKPEIKSNTTENVIYYGSLVLICVVLGGLLYIYTKDYFNNFTDLTPPSTPNNSTFSNNVIDIKGKSKAITPISEVDSMDWYFPKDDPQSSYTYSKIIETNQHSSSRIIEQLPNKNKLNVSILSSNMQSQLDTLEKINSPIDRVNSPTNSISSIDSNKTIK